MYINIYLYKNIFQILFKLKKSKLILSKLINDED